MTSFSVVTVKQLFGLSTNHCAFPGCEEVLIDPKWHGVKAEICHICAANPKGPRYDAGMTEEQRYSFENLILLCPTHHVVIDRLEPHVYTVAVLRDMKARVEDRAMPGERKMMKELEDYVERAVTLIIVTSNRYYSLPPLPPVPTSSPAYLEGRADSTSSVIGNLTVGAERSVISDSASAGGLNTTFVASMGGPSEEVTSVGGPGASLEHEVIRSDHDELGITDSATIADGDVHPTSLHVEFDTPKGESE